MEEEESGEEINKGAGGERMWKVKEDAAEDLARTNVKAEAGGTLILLAHLR